MPMASSFFSITTPTPLMRLMSSRLPAARLPGRERGVQLEETAPSLVAVCTGWTVLATCGPATTGGAVTGGAAAGGGGEIWVAGGAGVATTGGGATPTVWAGLVVAAATAAAAAAAAVLTAAVSIAGL